MRSKADVFLQKYKLLELTAESTKKKIAEGQSKMETLQDDIKLYNDVKTLLTLTSKTLKEKVITYISKFVTEALNFIYEDVHLFSIELEFRRNQYELSFFLSDNYASVRLKKPFVGRGGGKLTIISLLLRLALLELTGVRGPVILDEVTKMVDAKALRNACTFLRDYSERFDRTLLVVTHRKELMENSHILYEVTKKNGVSKVIEKHSEV